VDPAALASVAETHHRANPWAGISRRYPEGYFGLGFDAFTPDEMRSGAFYNEWMHPTGLGSHVVYGGFPVLRAGVDELLVVVMSATGTDDVDPFHLALGRRAMPYLKHTFALLEQLGGAAAQRDAQPWSARVLDRLRIAAFVVEAAGRIQYMNEAASELLERGDALRAVNGRLATALEHETRPLRERIARAASNIAACGGAVIVGTTGPRAELQLTVSPLADGALASRRALVLAAPADAPRASCAELLRRSFGLTRAEAGLIVRLGALLDLRQAADAERISYETARTYFKRSAEKLGVRSQAAAIERVRLLALIR
jgi:DNA-binding CsgD family transcriptional regulator/PAS domain-containing protein